MAVVDYFPEKPWACRCGCGFAEISPELVRRLNLARELSVAPYEIVSACRCRKHNAAEGGKDDSAHLYGQAVDIRTPDSIIRYRVLCGLLGAGFARIGIAKSFIHADVSTTLPQQVAWTY